MKIIRTIGNKSLWKREKTLFLTSRQAPMGCYESIFRWVEKFDKWGCAVCFNTSELEEEVLKALLVNRVPTTLVVTEKFKDTYNVQIEQALKERRLLILVLQREGKDGKGYTHVCETSGQSARCSILYVAISTPTAPFTVCWQGVTILHI